MLYLCHGRLEFTQVTLPRLLATTDWDAINQFVVYNDATPELNGETSRFVRETLAEHGFGVLRETNLHSPVAVMNHYLNRAVAERFAKIDNDIVVPDGWLEALAGVMDRFPQLDLLGMEPGQSGCRPPDNDDVVYDYLDCTHIGGVGLMRRDAFLRYGFPQPQGRFGFTEWQHQHEPQRGWIRPDLRTFALDLLPVEPWRSITDSYRAVNGLQRDWTLYNDPRIYEWWTT